MHRAEIQEILGGPPGDYRKGPKYLSPFSLKNIRLLDDDSPVEEFEEFWWGDAFVVKIIFDTEGRVIRKGIIGAHVVKGSYSSWWERLFPPPGVDD